MGRHCQNNAMRHLRKQHELITQQLPRLADHDWMLTC